MPESTTDIWGALGLSQGSGEVLLELGMGTGKVSLQAFVELPHLRSVIGVELAPSRYKAGESALQRLAENMPTRFRVVEQEAGTRILLRDHGTDGGAEMQRTLEFRCGDALKVDPVDMALADAVVMEFCMPISLHAAICAKMREFKSGVKIFSFTDFPMVWPEGMPGPRCHVRRCTGADGSLSDKYYKTSWSPTEGHPFFLLETFETAAQGISKFSTCTEHPVLNKEGQAIQEARSIAIMASNPSNMSWKELQSDVAVPGLYRVAQLGNEHDEVTYSLGQPVEVAPRWHYSSEGLRLFGSDAPWTPGWVVQVHSDHSMNVVYLSDGTLEELCEPARVRPGRHACALPTLTA